MSLHPPRDSEGPTSLCLQTVRQSTVSMVRKRMRCSTRTGRSTCGSLHLTATRSEQIASAATVSFIRHRLREPSFGAARTSFTANQLNNTPTIRKTSAHSSARLSVSTAGQSPFLLIVYPCIHLKNDQRFGQRTQTPLSYSVESPPQQRKANFQ